MEIKIEDLTTMDLQGEGAFDNVMTAMQTRLDREFQRSRIKGPDYAKVYLGTYEASLMNTIQFILGRQEADKKAELLVQQTITEKDQLLTAAIGRNHVAAQILQTEKQTEKLDHDIALVDKQGLKVTAETKLLIDQLTTEALKRDLMGEQINLAKEEILLKKEEVDIAKEKLKLTKVQVWTETAKINDKPSDTTAPDIISGMMGHQLAFQEAQSWVEKAKVFDDISDITNKNTTPPGKVGGVMGGQIRKIDNEGLLLNEKVETERAQTLDLRVDGSTVVGVIGKQKDLYEKQTNGFDRDAEQKLAKILTDTWSVRRTTDETGVVAGLAGLGDDVIKDVVDLAKSNLGT